LAFNFLGTLSLEQLNELRAFLSIEIENIDEQINFMFAEKDNLQQTLAEILSIDSTIGQSIYNSKLSDVQVIAKQLDANSGRIIEKAKKPFIENIKYKYERLEYKAKKLHDMIEQLAEKIDRKSIAKTQTTALLDSIYALKNKENSTHIFSTTEDMRNYFKGVFIPE
jgi:paraquat-inducible protein B